MIDEVSDNRNSREAQFLASQKARLDQIRGDHEHDESNGNQAKRKDFWKVFKIECSQIMTSLSLITTMSLVTSSQRNQALEKLQNLQLTIRAMEHYTLHSTKFTKNEEEFLPTYLKENSMPELPIADTRLINTEISTLKSRATEVQSVIFPKEKFSFKRYRIFLQSKNQELRSLLQEEKSDGQQEDIKNMGVDEGTSQTRKASETTFDGHTISNRFNCHIQVLSNGVLIITDRKTNQVETLVPPSSENKITALLVRDLDQCKLCIKGMYNSIHIIQTKTSQILIQSPVFGPVHITECIDATVVIPFCRQLRIHDCHNVKFVVHVASGPIIEGCKEMSFYQKDYNYIRKNDDMEQDEESKTSLALETISNAYWDVKDFDWLKKIKSPNFHVYAEDKARSDSLLREYYQDGCIPDESVDIPPFHDETVEFQQKNGVEENDSSEDEL